MDIVGRILHTRLVFKHNVNTLNIKMSTSVIIYYITNANRFNAN